MYLVQISGSSTLNVFATKEEFDAWMAQDVNFNKPKRIFEIVGEFTAERATTITLTPVA